MWITLLCVLFCIFAQKNSASDTADCILRLKRELFPLSLPFPEKKRKMGKEVWVVVVGRSVETASMRKQCFLFRHFIYLFIYLLPDLHRDLCKTELQSAKSRSLNHLFSFCLILGEPKCHI